jgi:hypothetical protein
VRRLLWEKKRNDERVMGENGREGIDEIPNLLNNVKIIIIQLLGADLCVKLHIIK